MSGAAENSNRSGGLLARYAPAVRAYFSRRISDRADVEDLTQEVFARLLNRADVGEIDNLEGYIFQVAANLLRERFRQRARRPTPASEAAVEDWVDLSEDFSPERILLGKEACMRFVHALNELPERTRTVFVLNRFEGLSGREIARRLGVSISTVEKDMMRAVAHVKAYVG